MLFHKEHKEIILFTVPFSLEREVDTTTSIPALLMLIWRISFEIKQKRLGSKLLYFYEDKLTICFYWQQDKSGKLTLMLYKSANSVRNTLSPLGSRPISCT